LISAGDNHQIYAVVIYFSNSRSDVSIFKQKICFS